MNANGLNHRWPAIVDVATHTETMMKLILSCRFALPEREDPEEGLGDD